eukprot:s611_g11.t1
MAGNPLLNDPCVSGRSLGVQISSAACYQLGLKSGPCCVTLLESFMQHWYLTAPSCGIQHHPAMGASGAVGTSLIIGLGDYKGSPLARKAIREDEAMPPPQASQPLFPGVGFSIFFNQRLLTARSGCFRRMSTSEEWQGSRRGHSDGALPEFGLDELCGCLGVLPDFLSQESLHCLSSWMCSARTT